MTAEALVMNKNGLAIAADSAISAPGRRAPKTFNTVDKLFALSDRSPVVAMVYGSAEFALLPWETLIKDYRAKTTDKSFPTIEEHATDFLSYLRQCETSDDEQKSILRMTLSVHFAQLEQDLRSFLEEHSEADRNDDTSVQGRIESFFVKTEERLGAQSALPEFADLSEQHFIWTHRRQIHRAIRASMRHPVGFQFTRKARHLLWHLAYLLITRDHFSSLSSGLVIAGFGDSQLLPSVRGYLVEGIFLDRMKCRLETQRDVTKSNQGIIIPFAQSEMVHRFLSGVDPDYQSYMIETFRVFASSLCDYLLERYVDNERRDGAREELGRLVGDKIAFISQEARDYGRDFYARPVIDAVKSLPKQELATLAEALVQLTSLRRKMSTDQDSVGEPIDVVVVSKGDGIVWIKRKQYFDAGLNPDWTP